MYYRFIFLSKLQLHKFKAQWIKIQLRRKVSTDKLIKSSRKWWWWRYALRHSHRRNSIFLISIFLIYPWQLKPFRKAIPSPVPEVLWSALLLITNPASTPLQILQNTNTTYNWKKERKIKSKYRNTHEMYHS